MQKKIKKLMLSKETLRNLENRELRAAEGGASWAEPNCPATELETACTSCPCVGSAPCGSAVRCH
jgi:hypothetical protein